VIRFQLWAFRYFYLNAQSIFVPELEAWCVVALTESDTPISAANRSTIVETAAQCSSF